MNPTPVLGATESMLWELFLRLRRRSLPLSPEDYEALRQALYAGFGWSSPQSLCDLCCALWAKSRREQELVAALFRQLQIPDISLPHLSEMSATPILDGVTTDGVGTATEDEEKIKSQIQIDPKNRLESDSQKMYSSLPAINLDMAFLSDNSLIFAEQFPLTHREIGQAWRHLRRPIREGPITELDITATVAQYGRLGVATPPILTSRRRNKARILLFCDRHGSMAPFHAFTDSISEAMKATSRLGYVASYYFHNVPAIGVNRKYLVPLANQLMPQLDTILSEIPAFDDDVVYENPDSSVAHSLSEVLRDYATGASVVIISDAGAARRTYDIERLMNTIAFMKAVRRHTSSFVWLNPRPASYWAGTTAAQLARHLPMFALDKEGLHCAINVLRGQPYQVEKPF